jgi:ParB/RepB/Spo0J family partition protein
MTTSDSDEPTIRTSMTPAPPPPGGPAPEAMRIADNAVQRSIPLADVKMHTNVRTTVHGDDQEIADLGESIRAHGLLHRPIFRSLPDSTVELICGTRRLHAYRYLARKYPKETQWQSFPVDIREIPDDAVDTVQFIENDQRQELTAVEIAHHVKKMKETLGWDEKTIAARFQWKAVRSVSYYMTIADSPDWLKIHAGKVSIPVSKLDKSGHAQRDDRGKVVMTQAITKPLGMRHLYELASFYFALTKYDKLQRALKTDHRDIATRSTQAVTKRAALEEWSADKLKTFLASEKADLTGAQTPDSGGTAKPPVLLTSPKKLTLDASSLTEPLPESRLREMKSDIVSVLMALGYKSVILACD